MLSRASTLCTKDGAAPSIWCVLHTPRFPISSKHPSSAISAQASAMKSIDKLLTAKCKRHAFNSWLMPRLDTAASRELLMCPPLDCLAYLCLCGLPALPRVRKRIHCAYSMATMPTPPAAACISSAPSDATQHPPNAMCAVLHADGSVHPCSYASGAGSGTTSHLVVRAQLASGASAYPNDGTTGPPVDTVSPAQSPPGGPGVPGYSPRTLSTSRKLRPTARTRRILSPSTSCDTPRAG